MTGEIAARGHAGLCSGALPCQLPRLGVEGVGRPVDAAVLGEVHESTVQQGCVPHQVLQVDARARRSSWDRASPFVLAFEGLISSSLIGSETTLSICLGSRTSRGERSVLMYFDTTMKCPLLQDVAAAIRPGGYLVIGDVDPVRKSPELIEMLRLDYFGRNTYLKPEPELAKAGSSRGS